MNATTSDAIPEHVATRFVPDRQANGLYGVYDLALGGYVLRDAPHAFAAAAALRLGAETWADWSEPQEAAAAVRRVLLATTGFSPNPIH